MCVSYCLFMFFFSSRRRHTRWPRDWSSDVCSSDLAEIGIAFAMLVVAMLIALRLSKASQLARELSWWLLGVVALQATIGYVQVFSGLPILMVAMHMLAASLLIVVMAFLMCELRRTPDEALQLADEAPLTEVSSQKN